MDKVIDAIMEALGDIVGLIIDIIVETLIRPLCIDFVITWRDVGDELFSNFITRAIEVLQMSPSEWNATGWGFIMKNVNVIFIAFGCQLVVLFFLMGFFAESVDPQRDIRIETVIRALFKILFAEYLVMSSAEIITTAFGTLSTLINNILIPSWMEDAEKAAQYTLLDTSGNFSMPDWDVDLTIGGGILLKGAKVTDIDIYLKHIDPSYFVLTLLAALIYMIVMIGAGGVIAYTAYIRFFKIMLIVPYGAMVSSTVAGNHVLSHTAIQYYKYVLGVILESLTIIVAISIYTVMMSGNEFEAVTMASAHSHMLCAFINRAIAALLLVGAVKGAGALTQKVLGS